MDTSPSLFTQREPLASYALAVTRDDNEHSSYVDAKPVQSSILTAKTLKESPPPTTESDDKQGTPVKKTITDNSPEDPGNTETTDDC